jgi:hypothetical protein
MLDKSDKMSLNFLLPVYNIITESGLPVYNIMSVH